jgi:fluoride exporter
MPIFLLVAIAGAAGATARYGLDLTFSRDAHHVPWVTFAINVGGSLALGAVVAVFDAHPHAALRPAITIGLLGSFTTFSTLSLETHRLLDRGHVALAAGYSLGSLAAGLAAVAVGVYAARVIL